MDHLLLLLLLWSAGAQAEENHTSTESDGFRLEGGDSRCAGRLDAKNEGEWRPGVGTAWTLKKAAVACGALDCGSAVSVENREESSVRPVWRISFDCVSSGSALGECVESYYSSSSLYLTCSEPYEIRLMGGNSRCAGRLEMKHEEDWRPVDGSGWTLKEADIVCRELDCGSVVSMEQKETPLNIFVWLISFDCVQSGFTLWECAESLISDSFIHNLICSDSVRLLNGTGLCSGRLEVRSNQGWSSVCEADFDQQDAEVVCRELGCGAPSALQGALYGEVEAPVGSKEFQCGGHESALLDCRSSDSARTTCSSGNAVGLTCSEPDEIRLMGGNSSCAGRLEMKHYGEWRPVDGSDWTLNEAAVACRQLDCGSPLFIIKEEECLIRPVWRISSDCVHAGSALRECRESFRILFFSLNLTCSDLLLQPVISVSSTDGVSQARQQGLQVFKGLSFTIRCSIQPQYPGGSFQLTFTPSSSSTNLNYSQPAVNHSTHFLFPVAEPAHQGNYTCVYQVYVFTHNFSSESRRLSVSVSDPTGFHLKVVFLPLTLLLLCTALYFYCEATRGQTSIRQEDMELVNYPLGVHL
ncbi:scavenger receptor cysteine-rich type 1 protein M130-like [Betta splendens]|uniref:Scavenger receptor cysteine-rich type 1 protein M130-like n=1 Tax=Betta splendens TaxID=158456 RepID=A0A6P7LDW9_BETSP|nr:scavenger receptor cysteine-rich type 1 protein M130-like [Betta splendens]